MVTPIKVIVWGENRHERTDEVVGRIYPEGMHSTIASGIRDLLANRVDVGTATLDQPEHGLSQEVLLATDVLAWWGHVAHAEVSDDVADRVCERVLAGMGLIVLHSGFESKIFRRLMGTSCSLRWRDADDREALWTVNPAHQIVEGVPSVFVIPRHEMYSEYFDIPPPETLIFISSFSGGEVFRSGCCFTRGRGRIFYFSPGHETHPVYYQTEIRRVIANAVTWAASGGIRSNSPVVSRNAPVGWFEEPA